MIAWNLRKAGVCSALVLAAGLCSGPAMCGEYKLVLGVDEYFDYDDNIDFTRTDETDATSFVLTPTARLNGKTERWDLDVDLDLPFERYSEDRLNSDNQNLQIASKRRMEKGELAVSGGILRDSTHRAEEDASGIQTRNAQRYVLDTFSSGWTRKLGEVHEFSISGSSQAADYASETRLHDYGYNALQSGWTRVINDRMTTQVVLFDSRLKSEVDPLELFVFPIGLVTVPVPDSETDTVGLQGGFIRVFSERLRGNFLVGGRHLKTIGHAFAGLNEDLSGEFDEVTSSDNGWLASAGLTYTAERLELDAIISRDLTPSGIGALFERDQIATDISYRLREHVFLHLHAVAYDNQSLDVDLPYERKYLNLKPHVEWRFRQNWTLLGGVNLRSQKLQGEEDAAESNSVFCSVTFASRPLSVFR